MLAELRKLAGKQFATEKTIEKIIDPLIKIDIKKHYEEKYKKNKTEAFSAEGINELNKKRKVPVYGFKIYYRDQSENYKLSRFANKKISDATINEILERITDEELKRKIVSHVDRKGDFKEAFSVQGLQELNKHLEEDFNEKNNGEKYKALTSIKLKAINTKQEEEEVDLSLLPLIRTNSYNNSLLVSTGSNYAFGVLEIEGKRHFDEISLFHATNIVNDAFKNGSKNINLVIKRYFEEKNKGSKFLFLLKQNDMVYLVPKVENVIMDLNHSTYQKFWNDKYYRAKNIYTVVKFSGKRIYFLKHDIANVLANKVEFGSQNCYEKVDGVSIKDNCIKVEIDHLGNVSLPLSPNNYITSSNAENTVTEPEATYQKKFQIKHFNSFEEMNESDARDMAAISPLTHLQNATRLTKKVFLEELKKPMDMRIKFN